MKIKGVIEDLKIFFLIKKMIVKIYLGISVVDSVGSVQFQIVP